MYIIVKIGFTAEILPVRCNIGQKKSIVKHNPKYTLKCCIAKLYKNACNFESFVTGKIFYYCCRFFVLNLKSFLIYNELLFDKPVPFICTE